MEKVTILCEKCDREITNREDLVVTFSLIFIVAYHSECFSKEIKGLGTMFVNNYPINGTANNWSVAIAVIVGIILLFTEYRYLSVLPLLLLASRVYSWLRFERYLPKTGPRYPYS